MKQVKAKVSRLNLGEWGMIDVDGDRYLRLGKISNLAKLLGTSKEMAQLLLRKDKVHSMKINGVLYAADDDLMTWAESQLPDSIDEWLTEELKYEVRRKDLLGCRRTCDVA